MAAGRPLTRREWGEGHYVGDDCRPAHLPMKADGHNLRPVSGFTCTTCKRTFASVAEHEDFVEGRRHG